MSSIKGGGRAKLSEENQNAIIDLLRHLRDAKDPLLPRKRVRGESTATSGEKTKELSDHNLKKERRRFVKKLVERHERVALSKRLNASSAATPQDAPLTNQLAEPTLDMSEQMHSLSLDATPDKPQVGSSAGGDISDKVRIILVEAVFSSKDKKKAKDKDDKEKKKKSKKDKSSSHPWKDGPTRKTMVLKRSTPVKEVLKQAKSKLNMKKKAVRCFYVDGKSKLDIDLEINLTGWRMVPWYMLQVKLLIRTYM